MDPHRFDTLVKSVSGSGSRRSIVRLLGGLGLGGALGAPLTPTPVLALRQATAVCAPGANSAVFSSVAGLAQSFTPDVSGKLSQVILQFSNPGTSSADYRLRLLRTDALGTPLLNRVMAKTDIKNVPGSGSTLDLLSITFKKRNAAKIVAGTRYAFFLTRANTDVDTTLLGRFGDPCAGGSLFSFINGSFVAVTDGDVLFEAFVGYG